MAAPRGGWPCWRCPRRERARLQMRSDPRLHEGLEPGAGSPLRAHSAAAMRLAYWQASLGQRGAILARGGARIVWLPYQRKTVMKRPYPTGRERNEADDRIGKWLSAALEDPQVCEEMKADIRFWFETRPKDEQAALRPAAGGLDCVLPKVLVGVGPGRRWGLFCCPGRRIESPA